MATENQTESSQTGNEELPIPQFSEQGVSPTSQGADDIVSRLTPVIEDIVKRTVQSTKDKRISELEKGQTNVLAVLEEMGVPITKEVRQELRLRELEERATKSPSQPAPKSVDGSTDQKAAVTDAIAQLNKYGLSSNDPAFIELLRGQYPNRDAFDKAVLGHVVTKLAPQKPANPADVIQSPATGGASGVDPEKLAVELQQLTKNPTGNMKRIIEIGDLLKKAG